MPEQAPDSGLFRNIFGIWQISPYRLCSIGCVYCNVNAPGASSPTLPKDELLRKVGNKLNEIPVGQPVGIGAFSDPYPSVEADLELTRQVLRLLIEARRDFVVLTRSAMVTRDVDLLASSPHCKGVDVAVSTTRDDEIARLEPGAPAYAERRDAVLTLSAARVITIVAASPWIPRVSNADEIMADFAGRAPVIFRALDLGCAETSGAPPTLAKRFFPELTRRNVNRAYLCAALQAGDRPGVAWMAPPGTRGGEALFSPMKPEEVRERLTELDG